MNKTEADILICNTSISQFDYHIFGIMPECLNVKENMKNKIIGEIHSYLQKSGSISMYYMNDKRDTFYEIAEIVDAVKNTIIQIGDNIYCCAYYPHKSCGKKDYTVLFFLWNSKVEEIFAVQSFGGIIVTEESVSIFSSHEESYGTIYGKINLNRSTLKYTVEKYEFIASCGRE